MQKKTKTDSPCHIILSRCSTDKDGELRFDTEESRVEGFNESFETVRCFNSTQEAEEAAVKALDREIERLASKGYALRCAPKTIDTCNHDWRRIARVGKEGEPSICIQVLIRSFDTYFDPWIF